MTLRECILISEMLTYIKDKKKVILIFLLVLVLSFSLRFTRVIFEKQPIFGDEAIYLRWSQIIRSEPSLRFGPQSDGKQPLFMWATIPLLKIFDDPMIAGRMLSVYTGVVTTAGIVILALLLFKSKSIALTAGFIHAISPFSVFFDSMALADSMLSMFGVWSLVFAVITIKRTRLDAAMLSGFALGGALLTKSPATFFAVFLPLTLILSKWPRKIKEKFGRLSVFVFLFTFTYAIAYGMYNILRLGPNFHMISIRNQDYVYSFSHLFESPFDPLLPFLNRILEYFWIMGPGVYLPLFSVGVWNGIKRFNKETLFLLVLGVVPILTVAEFSKTMTARYIYFTLPYLFILTAYGISLFVFSKNENLALFRSDFFKKVVLVLFIVFIGYSVILNFQFLTKPQAANLPRGERSGYFEEWTSGYGIKEASKTIRREYNNNPDQKIVVGTEGYFGTLPDGLQIYLNDIPKVTIIGVGVDLTDVPQSLRDSANFGNKTYFLINSTRLKTNYNKLDLNLILAL